MYSAIKIGKGVKGVSWVTVYLIQARAERMACSLYTDNKFSKMRGGKPVSQKTVLF
jgi:hypothetical protein